MEPGIRAPAADGPRVTAAMWTLPFATAPDTPLTVLCLGAHSDDIEIGCGGTMLGLLARHVRVSVHWHVFSGSPLRAKEAQASARLFLRKAHARDVQLHGFSDGFFPHEGAEIKTVFEQLKDSVQPDLIFTHCRHDLHQDHRVLCELAWNTWRNHLVLEYEIPKYDADLGAPNCFVPLTQAHARQKINHLLKAFPSQAGKQWFDEETFRALLRLRGLECNAPTRYAEAFYARKLVLG